MVEVSSEKSEVWETIQQNDWAKLFNNEKWLMLIDMANNINGLHGFEGEIDRQLKKVTRLFPKETKNSVCRVRFLD